ncbi:hypothetical protein ACIQOU_10950 [Streptomyces sp. NPDC091279]|uniref:hypothetical protein n=1 Tax=Streptomyces sp. NPDC091279 TaxID=3365983 RepID=UPI0037FAB516
MIDQFYASGRGDRLVDESLLPVVIRDFLEQEERLLADICQDFDCLVELGSMYGLHLEFAVNSDKKYLGLDVVDRYVVEGNRRVAALDLDQEDHRFLTCGIEDMGTIDIPGARALAFSPFNCLGNITDLPGALNGLVGSGLPFLLSSYRTDAQATHGREEYYDGCGYTEIRVRREPRGVRFTAAEGLDTVAYEPDHMLALLSDAGTEADVVFFGDIGACYVRSDLAPRAREAAGKLPADH